MNRKEMIQVLQEGGSVLYQGTVITRYEDLPTEAELAKGDAQAEAAAKNSLQAEIDRLNEQLKFLSSDSEPVKKAEKVETKSESKESDSEIESEPKSTKPAPKK